MHNFNIKISGCESQEAQRALAHTIANALESYLEETYDSNRKPSSPSQVAIFVDNESEEESKRSHLGMERFLFENATVEIAIDPSK